VTEGLEGQLLALVREVRALQHRVDLLRARNSPNSRALQAELAARIEQRQRQLAQLEERMPARTSGD
jgi:seryl-tRNA synthetase